MNDVLSCKIFQGSCKIFNNLARNVSFSTRDCSNAQPFNLVHFPKRDYPGKLTQREIVSEEELSEHLDCLSEYQRARIKLQKTILLALNQ